MKIIDIKDKDSIQNATKVLQNGGILIFPTDTVYGIGCVLNVKAIQKLYKLKNRSLDKPTAVLISKKTYNILYSSIKCMTAVDKILEKYPKGKVTVIVNTNNFKIKFPDILIKDNKVGVRVPNNNWLQELLDITGPIVVSSANLAGEITPKSFSDISPKLMEQADLVIKSDIISSNSPSTIYDIELNKIIRN